ncbi:MAG: hypothetical protein PHG61_08545, partial [Candidatus Marinimicrobia bacterium]|nr:hypothetical protein [Candidatus Neomarinimicrobiota bacterium]
MTGKTAKYNPAQQAAANAGASQETIDRLATPTTPAPTPAPAPAPTPAPAPAPAPAVPAPAVPAPAVPAPSPMSVPSPIVPSIPELPQTTPFAPSQSFIASNPAQLAAINAGVTDPNKLQRLTNDQLGAIEPPANAGADWLADYLANQQPIEIPSVGGGGGGGG